MNMWGIASKDSTHHMWMVPVLWAETKTIDYTQQMPFATSHGFDIFSYNSLQPTSAIGLLPNIINKTINLIIIQRVTYNLLYAPGNLRSLSKSCWMSRQ